MVGGVGTVASAASLGIHDAVHNETSLSLVQIFLHFFMTDHAKLGLAVGPQLKLIAAAVRVVTNRAITGSDRTVDMAHRSPFSIIDMTIETEGLDLAGGYHHLFGIGIGLVAGPAKQGGGGEMPPVGPGCRVAVTGIALWRKLSVTDLVYRGAGRQFLGMAASAFLGNGALPVKQINPGSIEINIEQGT